MRLNEDGHFWMGWEFGLGKSYHFRSGRTFVHKHICYYHQKTKRQAIGQKVMIVPINTLGIFKCQERPLIPNIVNILSFCEQKTELVRDIQ